MTTKLSEEKAGTINKMVSMNESQLHINLATVCAVKYGIQYGLPSEYCSERKRVKVESRKIIVEVVGGRNLAGAQALNLHIQNHFQRSSASWHQFNFDP